MGRKRKATKKATAKTKTPSKKKETTENTPLKDEKKKPEPQNIVVSSVGENTTRPSPVDTVGKGLYSLYCTVQWRTVYEL